MKREDIERLAIMNTSCIVMKDLVNTIQEVSTYFPNRIDECEHVIIALNKLLKGLKDDLVKEFDNFKMGD